MQFSGIKCIHNYLVCKHHHCLVTKPCLHPKWKAYTYWVVISHFLRFLALGNYYSFCLYEFAYCKYFVSGIIQYLDFYYGFFHLAQCFKVHLCCIACIGTSFLFYGQVIFHCMDKQLVYPSIHPLMDTELFPSLGFVNSAAMNIGVQAGLNTCSPFF